MKSLEKRLLNLETIVLVLLFVFISFFGGMMNLTVLTTNDGRMPVYWEIDSTKSHFSFQNFDEVQNPYLSDIFHIGNRIFSLGDLITITSLIFIFVVLVNYIYQKRKLNEIQN